MRIYLWLLMAVPLMAQYTLPGDSGGDPCTASFTASPSGLHCNTVTLVQANILAADATPFTLVPAAGAGNVIFPFMFRWKMAFGTHPYYLGGSSIASVSYMWWQNSANPFNTMLGTGSGGGGFAFDGDSCVPCRTGTAATLVGGLAAGTSVDPSNYTNQPLVLQTNSTVGNPGASGTSTYKAGPVLTVAVGDAAGTMYAMGDTVTLDQGGDCGFTVTSTGAGGSVTGLSVSTPGTNCTDGTNLLTDVATGMGDGTLTVNLTTQHGDGTLTVTTWYTVAPQ
jgi:hypothetical protein